MRRDDALVERAHLQRLERERAGEVGDAAGRLGVEHGERADRGHAPRAVEQRGALPAASVSGSMPARRSASADARIALVDLALALADQAESKTRLEARRPAAAKPAAPARSAS